MKMKKLITLSLTAMMLSVLFCSFAIARGQKSPHHFSGMVAFGTDGYSHGVSYVGGEDDNILVQAEIDYWHDNGLYAGIWGGNEDNTGGTGAINIYAGYWYDLFMGDFGPIGIDLMATWLHYPNGTDAGMTSDADYLDDEAEDDYWEFHVGFSYAFDLPLSPYLTLGLDWSPDYWGEDGNSFNYTAQLDLEIGYEIKLTFNAGYFDVEGDKQTGKDPYGDYWGLDWEESGFDYAYYSVGLSRDFLEKFNLDITYHFGMSEKDWYNELQCNR